MKMEDIKSFLEPVMAAIDRLAERLNSIETRTTIAEKGAQGLPGIKGDRGEKGESGEAGKDGSDGKDGQNGRDGKAGTDGRDGKDGEKGESGAKGLDGTNGKDGRDGIDGKNGINGEKGVDGQNGVNGTDGIHGKNGIDGKDGGNGVHGKDGKDGIDGQKGVDGSNGKDGRDGLDGKSITIADLTDWLEAKQAQWELKAEQRYEQRVRETIDKIQKTADEAIAALPTPKDGKDGLSLHNFKLRDGGRTICLVVDDKILQEEKTEMMIYRGIFDPDDLEANYDIGDAVTFGGSVWVAVKAAGIKGRPGTNDAWKLAVKRGRDASPVKTR